MSSNVHDVQEAPAGKRLALVIGVNKAGSAFESPLHHAISDAKAMAEVLEQDCGFELVVPPLLKEQATSGGYQKSSAPVSSRPHQRRFPPTLFCWAWATDDGRSWSLCGLSRFF